MINTCGVGIDIFKVHKKQKIIINKLMLIAKLINLKK